MDKAVFVHSAIHLIQAPAPVAVSGRKVRQIILRGVLYDQPGILRAIRIASDVDRRLAVIPILVDIDLTQFFAVLGSIQTKRHRRIHVCIVDMAITRLHEPSWRCLKRDRGCKEDVIQVQICRRKQARFVPVDLAGGPLIHDKGILRLEVEVPASEAIGDDLFVVIGRAGPEFVGVQRFVVTRKNIHTELVVGADVERMASGGLIDGPVYREIQLIRERIAAVISAVLIPVGRFIQERILLVVEPVMDSIAQGQVRLASRIIGDVDLLRCGFTIRINAAPGRIVSSAVALMERDPVVDIPDIGILPIRTGCGKQRGISSRYGGVLSKDVPFQHRVLAGVAAEREHRSRAVAVQAEAVLQIVDRGILRVGDRNRFDFRKGGVRTGGGNGGVHGGQRRSDGQQEAEQSFLHFDPHFRWAIFPYPVGKSGAKEPCGVRRAREYS